jgi:hypothetical protein
MQVKMHSKRPWLKTKGFSTFHIEIFNQILLDKTNRSISMDYGYSIQSHAVVDHSRKVMFKLLALEGLSRAQYVDYVKHPRNYLFWWKYMLDKYKDKLYTVAIKPEFYLDKFNPFLLNNNIEYTILKPKN